MPFISNFPSWISIRHYWPNVRSWYMPYVMYSESFVKCWVKRMGRLRTFFNNSSVHVTGNFTRVDSNMVWLSSLSFLQGQKRLYLKPQNIFSVDCLHIFLCFSPFFFVFYKTGYYVFQTGLKLKVLGLPILCPALLSYSGFPDISFRLCFMSSGHQIQDHTCWAVILPTDLYLYHLITKDFYHIYEKKDGNVSY